MGCRKYWRGYFMKGYYYSSYGSDQDQYPHMLQVLEKCAPLDVGVELSIYTRISARPKHIPELIAVKDQFTPYKTLFHGPFFELEATSEPDSEAAAYMLESYRTSYELCKMFRAPSIVMHTNQISYEDKDKLHLQENSRNMILKLGDLAREAGVELTVENVGFNYNHSVLFDENEFVELIQSLPEDIGALLDTGHAILNDWDMERLIARLGNRFKSYHIHNNPGDRDSHRPLFEDGMKYSRNQLVDMFKAMEKYSPDADWILEYSPGPHITPELMYHDFCEVESIRKAINL